ncbi:MAG: PDDEXK nuclease domain-containing protein [Pirellulales bacterium]
MTKLSWTQNLLIMSRCKRRGAGVLPTVGYPRKMGKTRTGAAARRRGFRANRSFAGKTVSGGDRIASRCRDRFQGSRRVLQLPPEHSESDLERALVEKLKQFLIELGRDFCFVGSQYPLQVGGRDFSIDLLFFNRALNCLVTFDLKIDEFQPEHLGKLEFYLEALDRDVKSWPRRRRRCPPSSPPSPSFANLDSRESGARNESDSPSVRGRKCAVSSPQVIFWRRQAGAGAGSAGV